jgi:hypothetical protein
VKEKPRDRLKDRLERGDSYGLLLGLIIVTYALMAVLNFGGWGRVVISGLFAAILLLAIHTSHVRKRGMRIGIVFAAVSVGVNIVAVAIGSSSLHFLAFLLIIPVLAAPIIVLNNILRHTVVNVETLLGAISAYALIGIAFAAVYSVMNLVAPPFFAQAGEHDGVAFLYFSFVTITTLGFGDLTPGKDVGRVLVSLEALLGQIFLVTLVARLVSQYGSTRSEPESPSEEF